MVKIAYSADEISTLEKMQLKNGVRAITASRKATELGNPVGLAAYNVKKSILIIDFFPGVPIKKLEHELEISDQHVIDFIKRRILMYKNGINFDNQGENILYDSKLGFAEIDLSEESIGDSNRLAILKKT